MLSAQLLTLQGALMGANGAAAAARPVLLPKPPVAVPMLLPAGIGGAMAVAPNPMVMLPHQQAVNAGPAAAAVAAQQAAQIMGGAPQPAGASAYMMQQEAGGGALPPLPPAPQQWQQQQCADNPHSHRSAVAAVAAAGQTAEACQQQAEGAGSDGDQCSLVPPLNASAAPAVAGPAALAAPLQPSAAEAQHRANVEALVAFAETHNLGGLRPTGGCFG